MLVPVSSPVYANISDTSMRPIGKSERCTKGLSLCDKRVVLKNSWFTIYWTHSYKNLEGERIFFNTIGSFFF